MLTQEQVELFERNGFLNGGPLLSVDEVDALNAEVMRVIEHHDRLERKPVSLMNLSGDPEAPVWQIVNIWQASDLFRDLVNHRGIVGSIAQLLKANELRVWHDQIQYKPAQIGGVNMWHQDGPYWPILRPDTAQVTAWVALDDVDLDNGCMSMAPGSHRWGDTIEFLHTLKSYEDLPQEFNGERVEVAACPVKKGHVHFHHALTWHGSGPNKSGRPRRAIAIHYMSDETVFVSAGRHLMKPFIAVADGEKVEGEAFPVVWPR